jgi:hypothetical protein
VGRVVPSALPRELGTTEFTVKVQRRSIRRRWEPDPWQSLFDGAKLGIPLSGGLVDLYQRAIADYTVPDNGRVCRAVRQRDP